VFDTLTPRRRYSRSNKTFDKLGYKLPVMISGTIRMPPAVLIRTNAAAFWYSLKTRGADFDRLQLRIGRQELRQYIEELSNIADTHVSAHPTRVYPTNLANTTRHRNKWPPNWPIGPANGYLNIIGGCCGTSPDTIRAISARSANIRRQNSRTEKRVTWQAWNR